MEGVTNIIEIIKSKTAAQAEQIVKEAEAYKEERLKQAKQRAKAIVAEATEKADRQAGSEIGKYRASAHLKSKYKILESKEAIMKEVLDGAWEAVTKKVGKAGYDQILNRLAVEGGSALQTEDIEILFSGGGKSTVDAAKVANEVNKQTGTKPKISISKETVRASGGLIVRSKDGEKWVDNTYEARMERLENEIRGKIASILFGKDE
ncbi:MAG: V-type ATP synthase subunit E [Promethearchaeota archaeon]